MSDLVDAAGFTLEEILAIASSEGSLPSRRKVTSITPCSSGKEVVNSACGIGWVSSHFSNSWAAASRS